MTGNDRHKELEELLGSDFAQLLEGALAAGLFKLDPNCPTNKAKVLMTSNMRNRFLRRAGRVEYRCKRGCFLGAVFIFEGQEYIYWRQWTAVDEVCVPLDEMGNYRVPPDPRAHDRIEEAVSWEAGLGLLSDAVLLRPSTISEMGALDALGDGNTDWCTEWPVSSVYTSDDNTLNANCGHSELVITPEQIERDIERLRRSKKKVVFVGN